MCPSLTVLENLETGAMLEQVLRDRGWRVGQINGKRSAEENETTRNAYQSGELDAVIFTVTESISLHQGELPGGNRPRAQVIHDMRHSAVQLQQIEGRSNRDGSGAVVYYTYAEDTVEEAITAANLASREHPCRIIVVVEGSRRSATRTCGSSWMTTPSPPIAHARSPRTTRSSAAPRRTRTSTSRRARR